MRKYLYILAIIYLLSSCEDAKFPNASISISNVSISTSEYDHNLFDPPILIESDNYLLYQPIFQDGKYKMDSIPNGTKKFSVFSLLTGDIEKSINLQTDTLISFDAEAYPNFTRAKDFMMVNIKTLDDTVFVGQNITGCFNHHLEKLVLYTKNNKLHVEYYSTEPYQFGLRELQMQMFEKDTLYKLYFKKFIYECKRLYQNRTKNYTISTTSVSTYIRQGEFYYELPDIHEWTGFMTLKTDLGIRPFELNGTY